jgi:SAM-dependent methyltransferase
VNGHATGGNEELLSKSLVQAIEDHWLALATDLLAQGTVTSLAEAEAAARRLAEQCLFDALRGDLENVSAESTLAQVVRMECPPIDVLEAVHQHLLSRQLHQSPDGELQCCSSRHHRRSRGIYYTPDYIAEYLTERCLSGRNTPSPPRILDPACGSGRFLLAAAQYLLRQGNAVTEIARSLHGCDLDEEAVQVARRILLLALTPHVAAPNDVNTISAALDENIICGNSLTNSLWEKSSLPSEARGRVREGDEAPDKSSPPTTHTHTSTSSILQPPASSLTSFDIILGNPPYRRELGTKELLDEIALTEFGRRYRAPRMDLWYYFLHRGIELLAPDGRLGFIVGAYWAAGTGANRLIAMLRETVHIGEIFQLDRLQVFRGVAGHHMMLVLSKPPSSKPTTVRLPIVGDATDARSCVEGRGEVHTFTKTPDQLFRQGLLDLEPPAEHLLDHLSHFATLGQLGKIRQGIAENPASVTKTANRKHGERWQIGKGVFALTPEELVNLALSPIEQHLIRPYHDLCDLGRYDRADDPSLRLIYSTRQTWAQLDDFPILAAHLTPFRPIMEARRETRQGIRAWWQLHWPREELIWEQPKLLALQMAQRPTFVPAQTPTYVSFSVNVFLPAPGVREHLNYFAALLNSRLLWKWFRHHAKRRGVGLEINGHVLARAPIRQIDFDSPQDTDAHDQLVSLVNRMLELSRRRRIVPRPEIDVEWRDIDHQIDRLVYKLYDLDEDDIAAIEAACRES